MSGIKYAAQADFERACAGFRAMLDHGMTFADIGRWCHLPRGSNALYRRIVNGTATGMSPTNAAKMIDGYDRFRARPPEIVPVNKAHPPSDASRAFSYSLRTKRGDRTPPKPRPPKPAAPPEPPPYESRFVARWKARCREGRIA